MKLKIGYYVELVDFEGDDPKAVARARGIIDQLQQGVHRTLASHRAEDRAAIPVQSVIGREDRALLLQCSRKRASKMGSLERREMTLKALDHTEWDLAKAAQILEIRTNSLETRLYKYQNHGWVTKVNGKWQRRRSYG